MAIGDIIVGIDIGTSKVSTVVGEVNNFNQIETICSTSCKCSGLQKGKIINEEEVTLYMVNPKAPCFIRDEEQNYVYLILPVNFTTVS